MLISISNCVMEASQRSRSPARPVTSFSARMSFPSKSSSSSSNFFLLDVLSSYLFLSVCTLASTSARASCATFSAACFFASVSCAAFSFARLGATSLLTCPYTSIARTHRHSPFAAPDTLATVSGWKSGLLVYFPIFFSSESSNLSLSNSSSLLIKEASPNWRLHSSQLGGRFSTVITADSVSSTSMGGLAYAFSSLMSFFVSTFSAASAACSAGIALSSPS
mmetsp:Transcript_22071/g.39403  ORF Transcript_22071/g.39403 Transcript_22071/m.39403 type:complete len:222 (+) Transcript_22071:303-968(+)